MPSPFLLDTPSEPRRSSTARNRKRVLLIVDDEEGPRQSIRIVFKEEYQILMANDGLQAMEHARHQTVDAAVLDIRMFGMSGIDLLKQLKEIDPAIEVVMLTAYETLETARQALRLGACDYLTKPFDIATLRDAVGMAMQRRSISDEIRSNNEKLKELRRKFITSNCGKRSPGPGARFTPALCMISMVRLPSFRVSFKSSINASKTSARSKGKTWPSSAIAWPA